ncbi:unnamed protein product, partial [Meganyctiphanes norvegica]
GYQSHVWLAARGVAGQMVVTQGPQANTTISRSNYLWAPAEVVEYFRFSDCLYLKVWLYAVINRPATQAYYSQPCSQDINYSWKKVAQLCEVPLLFNYNDLIVNPGEQA